MCVGAGEPEGDEEQARLVDVAIVLVDDGDLCLGLGIEAPQPIGGQRSTRSAAQDHHTIAITLVNAPAQLIVRVKGPSPW